MQSTDTGMKLDQILSLLSLTFAAFIFNTSEFIPIGLLTDIRNDFGLTEQSVGMLISIYAWAVMLLSLPLMLMVSKLEMKRLMLGLLAFFTIFQVTSFLSTSFTMLVLSRVGVACTHAIFWSIVSPMAVRIVPRSISFCGFEYGCDRVFCCNDIRYAFGQNYRSTCWLANDVSKYWCFFSFNASIFVL